jgi:hypothetical protein
MSNDRISAFLTWRPVLLFGGGLGLAIFEAVQPLLGHSVEWAIVSLAATMMGLEVWQRSQAPDNGKNRQVRKDTQAPEVGPESQGNRDNPAALAVRAALAGLVSRKAPAVAVAAVG